MCRTLGELAEKLIQKNGFSPDAASFLTDALRDARFGSPAIGVTEALRAFVYVHSHDLAVVFGLRDEEAVEADALRSTAMADEYCEQLRQKIWLAHMLHEEWRRRKQKVQHVPSAEDSRQRGQKRATSAASRARKRRAGT